MQYNGTLQVHIRVAFYRKQGEYGTMVLFRYISGWLSTVSKVSAVQRYFSCTYQGGFPQEAR